ncbi:MAG: hypothetical protein EA401_01105 [Planctomycetota bacterium]|nr:MAG: hypothetical protein EA401_01105 [Planctomycetota bacterium]
MNDRRHDGFLDARQQRDRQVAARPHYGPRRAVPVDSLVHSIMQSPEVRRLKRQRHLSAALASVFTERERAQIHVRRWSGNTLTLAVSGSPLLAELRQFRYTALLKACTAHGVGVSNIRFVLQRSGR